MARLSSRMLPFLVACPLVVLADVPSPRDAQPGLFVGLARSVAALLRPEPDEGAAGTAVVSGSDALTTGALQPAATQSHPGAQPLVLANASGSPDERRTIVHEAPRAVSSKGGDMKAPAPVSILAALDRSQSPDERGEPRRTASKLPALVNERSVVTAAANVPNRMSSGGRSPDERAAEAGRSSVPASTASADNWLGIVAAPVVRTRIAVAVLDEGFEDRSLQPGPAPMADERPLPLAEADRVMDVPKQQRVASQEPPRRIATESPVHDAAKDEPPLVLLAAAQVKQARVVPSAATPRSTAICGEGRRSRPEDDARCDGLTAAAASLTIGDVAAGADAVSPERFGAAPEPGSREGDLQRRMMVLDSREAAAPLVYAATVYSGESGDAPLLVADLPRQRPADRRSAQKAAADRSKSVSSVTKASAAASTAIGSSTAATPPSVKAASLTGSVSSLGGSDAAAKGAATAGAGAGAAAGGDAGDGLGGVADGLGGLGEGLGGLGGLGGAGGASDGGSRGGKGGSGAR